MVFSKRVSSSDACGGSVLKLAYCEKLWNWVSVCPGSYQFSVHFTSAKSRT